MKIVIAAAVLLLSACGSVPTSRTAAGFPACDPSRPVQTVTLVHVTDLHEHYGLAADGISPYARIRGYFDSIRNENRASLFMDGGDDQEKGSIAGQLSNGVASRDMIRAMGFDARVMGNHDFAWGEGGALDHSHDPHAVVLATNIRYVGKDPVGFGATDYAEIHVGCVTLGLVGPVTTPWNAEDEPFAGQYPGFRGNYDYAAAVRAALKKRRDADAIIVLSHLGREDDLKLAAAVPSVDLVLGGHTHGVTWEPISAGRAKYVESGHDAEYVTRVDLDFDPRTRRLIGLRHDLTRVGPDMPVDSAVQDAALRALASWAPVGDEDRFCACRDADRRSAAEVAARAAMEELGVDAAFVDVGNVWVPWKAGSLAPQDFLDAFKIERQPPGAPGFNAFEMAEMSGAVLKAAIRGADPKRWVYSGPAAPLPGRRYRVALPRRAALYPQDQLSLAAPLRGTVLAGEAFEILDRYAARRYAGGLCIDDGCVPGTPFIRQPNKKY